MKQNNKIILLLAVFLMLMTVFTVPALAEEGEDPCIAAGTCVDPDPGDDETDPGDEDTDPDDEDFIEEEAISIYADGTTESMKLDHNIDSEETGAELTAVNSGKITLTVDEEGMVEIYGANAGVLITTEGSGSTVNASTSTIDSEILGLGIDAGKGTTVSVTNTDFIGGNTAVDIVNDGGTVTVKNGYVEGVVGVSLSSGSGETTVETTDINANGYGIFLDITEEGESGSAQAPKVKVTVDGDIKDDLGNNPGTDDPGFDPDDPVDPGEETEPKDADNLSPSEGGSDILPGNDDIDDPDSENDGDDEEFTIENSTGISITADIRGAEVEAGVSGGISMSYGNEVEADNGSVVKLSVGKAVETDYGNRISASGSSTVEVSFGSDINAGGKAIDTYTDSASLKVGANGDVISEDTDDGDFETVGIYTNSEGDGTTEITVGKGIKVTSREKDYTAYGIEAANIGGKVTIDVNENVAVSGDDAVGIYLLNDPDGGSFGDEEEGSDDPDAVPHAVSQPETLIKIKGNAAAAGTRGGTGAEIWNQNGKTDLQVNGDLTGSEYGLNISAFGTGPDSFADILVAGTISGKKAGIIVNDEADNDGTADDNLNLTVWKVTPSANGNIAVDEDGKANTSVEENIKYIVKIAEGYEDKIKAVDENGDDLPVSHGFYYAKQGQRIYLEALNGYDLKEAYNGVNPQIPLSKDDEGRFYLDVPKGGGVLLSPVKSPEPGPRPEPEPFIPGHHMDFFRIGDLHWLHDVKLPGTGFSASHVTALPARPQGLSYGTTGLTLQIPELGVSGSIVTVPNVDNEYPVEWLGSSIGLLEQSSLPGNGVSVLAGHNHLNTTETGPFLFLGSLEDGARMMVTDARNNMQTYQVYGNYKIASDGFAEIADEVRENALVLITCEDESVEGGYLNRRVILAEPL